MEIGNDVDLWQIAEETELFTGAELEGLCREAGIVALREDICATMVRNRHFQTVKASLKPALTKAEIDSYASFMKNPTSKCSTKLESGIKHESKKSISVLSSNRVRIGALSCMVLAITQYFLIHNWQLLERNLPTWQLYHSTCSLVVVVSW